MSALAVIPARSGSKSLPGKNVRLFHGRPLLHWSISAARESGVAERIIVSTDDEEIATIARAGGAEVPFLRPAALAQDDSPMLDVMLDLLTRLESVPENVLLLQPTSPLRNADDLRRAAALLADADAVVSVTAAKHHPQWLQRISPEGLLEPFTREPAPACRQDLPKVYALNGALYLVRTTALRAERTFRPARTLAYEMPAERSVDIDSELDWRLAELVFSSHQPHG